MLVRVWVGGGKDDHESDPAAAETVLDEGCMFPTSMCMRAYVVRQGWFIIQNLKLGVALLGTSRRVWRGGPRRLI